MYMKEKLNLETQQGIKLTPDKLKTSSGNFLLPKNTKININDLYQKTTQQNFFKINNGPQTEEEEYNRKYLSISFYEDQTKNTVNIYPDGTFRTWWYINSEDWGVILKFIKLVIINECLIAKEE